jgi:hypothetical protein
MSRAIGHLSASLVSPADVLKRSAFPAAAASVAEACTRMSFVVVDRKVLHLGFVPFTVITVMTFIALFRATIK